MIPKITKYTGATKMEITTETILQKASKDLSDLFKVISKMEYPRNGDLVYCSEYGLGKIVKNLNDCGFHISDQPYEIDFVVSPVRKYRSYTDVQAMKIALKEKLNAEELQ
jgi:hypothetical protein